MSEAFTENLTVSIIASVIVAIGMFVIGWGIRLVAARRKVRALHLEAAPPILRAIYRFVWDQEPPPPGEWVGRPDESAIQAIIDDWPQPESLDRLNQAETLIADVESALPPELVHSETKLLRSVRNARRAMTDAKAAWELMNPAEPVTRAPWRVARRGLRTSLHALISDGLHLSNNETHHRQAWQAEVGRRVMIWGEGGLAFLEVVEDAQRTAADALAAIGANKAEAERRLGLIGQRPENDQHVSRETPTITARDAAGSDSLDSLTPHPSTLSSEGKRGGMSLLTKIFGQPKMTYAPVAKKPSVDACCVNRTLMPRWRGPEVMGDDDQAMGFVCHACGREFLPAEVENRRLIRAASSSSSSR